MLDLTKLSVGAMVQQHKYCAEYTSPGETYEVVAIETKYGRPHTVWLACGQGQTCVSSFNIRTCFSII